MRAQILNLTQYRALARPTSVHLDEDDVNAYIREVEDKSIIPAIGYDVYKYVSLKGTDSEPPRPATLSDAFNADVFLDGGEYADSGGDDCRCGSESLEKTRYCNGLRRAVAYMVWAMMLRADGSIISRAGAMRHREDYADHVDDSKLRQYDDAYMMGQTYLSEALYYLKTTSVKKEVKPVRGARVRIHAVGN